MMKFNITPSEEEVMNLLWDRKQWMEISEMITYFEDRGKHWKRQTVNTFLAHLMEKGLVVKNGRKYIYAYSREEYESLKAKEVLDTLYHGSLQRFVSALSGSRELSREEVEGLKAYLEKLS